VCKTTGACNYNALKSECQALSDEDCDYRSLACKNLGHCKARDGVCKATHVDQCKESKACKEESKCVLMGGTCVVAGTKPATLGDLCTTKDECFPNMLCVTIDGRTRGHCSKKCTGSGECSGAPSGTKAFCVLTDSKDASIKYCAFMCAYKDSSGSVLTAACPSYQSCSTQESPAGSGQKLCVP